MVLKGGKGYARSLSLDELHRNLRTNCLVGHMYLARYCDLLDSVQLCWVFPTDISRSLDSNLLSAVSA